MNPKASVPRDSSERDQLKGKRHGQPDQTAGRLILERFGYHQGTGFGELEFYIPADSAVEDVMIEIQCGYLASSGRSAISAEVLEACIDFARKEKQAAWIGVHRVFLPVENSTNKSTSEQHIFLASRGLKPAHLIKTVVAHALHHLATGRDILDGEYVRTQQGTIVFEEGGLSFDPEDDGYLNGNVGMSGEPIIWNPS